MSEIVIAIKRTCKCVLPEGAPDILLLDTDYYCPVCKRQCEACGLPPEAKLKPQDLKKKWNTKS